MTPSIQEYKSMDSSHQYSPSKKVPSAHAAAMRSQRVWRKARRTMIAMFSAPGLRHASSLTRASSGPFIDLAPISLVVRQKPDLEEGVLS
ncbi:hypothetical protein AMECASPLE_030332 [Ameca splendens]|uniref:Uncharacterized protein n=1 Tax=Ameca splendens TaxID=208324 RepID=A0ABV0YHD0_9TELE